MPDIVIFFEKESDEALLLLIKEDNRAAFAALYDRYWLILIKKALFKLANQGDAEEIVQTVFVNLWRARHSIVIRERFKQYVFTMLRNEIFRFLSEKLHASGHLQIEEIKDHEPRSEETGLSQVELKELEQKIGETVESLPEKCKLIFRMSREEGLSAKQIASELDISHRTVETQLSKAIKIIKTALHRINILLFIF